MFAVSQKQTKENSVMVKFIISGVSTWLFELICGHALEFLKIAKQTKNESYKLIIKEITKSKGILGFLDGFFPFGSIQALSKGACFGAAHVIVTNTLNPFIESGQICTDLAKIIAGGISGGIQGLVLSPVLLLKTRVMTNPIFRKKMSLMETSRRSVSIGVDVIKNEGVAALMKGSVVFASKRVADWSTRFFFAELFEDIIFDAKNKNLNTFEKMTASLFGGVMSCATTIPIDAMVAQIQQTSKSGKNINPLKTFMFQYKNGGIKSIIKFSTNGFIPRTVHVALTTALMKTMVDSINDWYFSLM